MLPRRRSATCTINNNDQPAHLTLVKTVTNDNGGTAAADGVDADGDRADHDHRGHRVGGGDQRAGRAPAPTRCPSRVARPATPPAPGRAPAGTLTGSSAGRCRSGAVGDLHDQQQRPAGAADPGQGRRRRSVGLRARCRRTGPSPRPRRPSPVRRWSGNGDPRAGGVNAGQVFAGVVHAVRDRAGRVHARHRGSAGRRDHRHLGGGARPAATSLHDHQHRDHADAHPGQGRRQRRPPGRRPRRPPGPSRRPARRRSAARTGRSDRHRRARAGRAPTTLSESGPPGYTASVWICTGGAVRDATSVTLTEGRTPPARSPTPRSRRR